MRSLLPDRDPVVAVGVPSSCVVYTPPALARAMALALGHKDGQHWLEPCVGNGVFLRSLRDLGVPRRSIRALDISAIHHPADSLGLTLRATEFIGWAAATSERFDKIIANPPFVALSQVAATLRRRACDTRFPGLGTVVQGTANLWFAFFCASVSLLKHGGSLAFVLPAAWQYADYAASVRDVLPTLFGEVEEFRCSRPLFGEVQDGSVVLVARDYGAAAPSGIVARRRFGDADPLIDALSVSAVRATRRRTDSCTELVSCCRRGDHVDEHHVRLDSVFRLGIGAVTGQSDYFVLSDAQRKAHGLPEDAFVPVVSRAKHLSGPSITEAHWRRLLRSGERLWLFRPTGDSLRHASVRRYLELSPERGGCRRDGYKMRNRTPWYVTPLPAQAPDGFISGMSARGPWLVLNRMRCLTATNTLYVLTLLTPRSHEERSAWALSFLSTSARRHLEAVARRYPSGLLKFEPKDLKSTPLRVARSWDGATAAYKLALSLFIQGDYARSSQLADRWLESGRLRA